MRDLVLNRENIQFSVEVGVVQRILAVPLGPKE